MATTTHELDKQISQLSDDFIKLKIRRNASVPISQLAAEIFIKIATVAVGAAVKDVKDVIRLCHVSHSWRVAILGFPQLWTTMTIQYTTKARFLKFVMKNAQDLPMSITINIFPNPNLVYGAAQSNQAPPNPRAMKTMTRLLSDTQRLKSIHYSTEHAGFLAHCATGRADALESLQIVEMINSKHRRLGTTIPPTLFQGGTPNLRSLNLVGHSIPWTSHLLQSSHFTDIALTDAPEDRGAHLAQLYNILKRAPHLRAFEVTASPWIPHDLESNANPTHDEPVELRNLARLKFRGAYLISLSQFLERIRIPPQIPFVWLECGFLSSPTTSAQDVYHQLFTAWRRARGGVGGADEAEPMSPEQMRISWAVSRLTGAGYLIESWREPQASQDFYTSLGNPAIAPADITLHIQCGQYQMGSEPSFPFSHPQAYNCLWSFADLRVLILLTPVPPIFWTEMSKSPKLEEVLFDADHMANVGFLNTLADGDASSRIGTAQRRIIPFPALRNLIVENVGQSGHITGMVLAGALIKRRGLSVSSGEETPPAAQELLPLLAQIEFRRCAGGLDEMTRGVLSEVTSQVVWRSHHEQVEQEKRRNPLWNIVPPSPFRGSSLSAVPLVNSDDEEDI